MSGNLNLTPKGDRSAQLELYLTPDDDRIVSHDAIFYVRDATSKLSWISA